MCVMVIAGKAQTICKKVDSIVTEAKKLYTSQVAGIYGKEVLRQQYPLLEDRTGGSVTYSENGKILCVFFSNEENPSVVATIGFDNINTPGKPQVDTAYRNFTGYERDLYTLQKKTEEQIATNSMFKKCSNTRWNIVPLTDNKSKRVYVFTGSKVNGTVVFGNDYLLTFDDSNALTVAKPLHQNMIPLNYHQDKDMEPITTVHNHSGNATDCFTATDVCTVMLYEKCANWKKHMVISKSQVSTWDCEKDELVTVSLKEWEKSNK
ncbi:hypothetical protein FLA_5771 [Filimonas lacunae]|nr:hypothetical protein FLA_5771 [Filimonas lacunae]